MMRKKIAVFASGFGSNLQALIDFNTDGDLGGDIALVLSNESGAFALKRAKNKIELQNKANINRLIGQSRHVVMGEMIAILTHQ